MGNSPSKGVGSGGAKITKQDRAILDLKLQRDKIRQYQKRVQIVSDKEQEAAKAFLARGDRERAKAALRRKRYQETILLKTDAQLETLQGLVSNIEFSQIEASVLHGLRQGNDVLKEMHKEMTLENVERLMEDTAEAQAYQREIDEALQSKMSVEDEEAIADEMRRMEREQLGNDEEEAEPQVELPSAPTQQPVRTEPVIADQERAEEEEEEVELPVRQAVLA